MGVGVGVWGVGGVGGGGVGWGGVNWICLSVLTSYGHSVYK